MCLIRGSGSLQEHLNKQKKTRMSLVLLSHLWVKCILRYHWAEEAGRRPAVSSKKTTTTTVHDNKRSRCQFEPVWASEQKWSQNIKQSKNRVSGFFCVMSDIYTVYTTWFFRINFSCGGNSRTIFVWGIGPPPLDASCLHWRFLVQGFPNFSKSRPLK